MTLFFIVFFVFPVLSLFAVSLDKPVAGVVAAKGDFVLNNYVRFFHQPLYYDSIFRTVWISVACSAIAALLGYPLAYLIAKTEHPGRNTFLMILVLASMQLDGVIRLYGMMVLLGDNGLINGTLMRWHAIDKPLPADVQHLRRDRGRRPDHPAVHGAVADRRHPADQPFAGGGGAQPGRVAVGDLPVS